jgi:hypothetical protein
VEGVEVDFDRKTATVTMKPGRPLARAEVEKALSGEGYSLTSFEGG